MAVATPVLACTGFRDDTLLAHASCQQSLPDHVIDLVSARMVQVFAFQVNLRATQYVGPAGSVINGRRATDVMFQFMAELGQKIRIVLVTRISLVQFIQCVNKGFGNETATVNAEWPLASGK